MTKNKETRKLSFKDWGIKEAKLWNLERNKEVLKEVLMDTILKQREDKYKLDKKLRKVMERNEERFERKQKRWRKVSEQLKIKQSQTVGLGIILTTPQYCP